MIELRPLSEGDFDALLAAFNESFSDYLVPFSLTAPQLREMLTRRGWHPALSCGAFDGQGLMVGFTVNGFDGTSGYDSGTGVRPSHRRLGLARRLMEESIRLLREAGARRYVLEVLEPNGRAIELYRTEGFQEVRLLQCWTFTAPAGNEPSSVPERADPTERDALECADVRPSWQNSLPSIRRAKDHHVTLGDGNGYAVVFPSNGDLPQLAVRRGHRHRGEGRRLLHAAAALAGKPLRILNVDCAGAGVAAFLTACGATPTIRQLEMELMIPST